MGPISDPICAPLPPKLGVGNPQSKLALQIAAKWYQIQGWFVLTAYGNLPAPYPTVPSSTPYGHPFPQNWGNQKIKLNTAEKA